jgi:branched-subunit amino acid transport protein AzlD
MRGRFNMATDRVDELLIVFALLDAGVVADRAAAAELATTILAAREEAVYGIGKFSGFSPRDIVRAAEHRFREAMEKVAVIVCAQDSRIALGSGGFAAFEALVVPILTSHGMSAQLAVIATTIVFQLGIEAFCQRFVRD